ncbi:hypothetical protein FH505_18360 [Bacillus velezensis]|uniref:hypothetical protein n=1 Tax=Bacillus velezensis TaxID=492670 RepID=UPI0011233CD8|nr:hypothetical protein [Bacillus velezensis]TNU61820.1 hypothetical protein FH505_18360 [Bacillus velezensis]
MEEINIKLSTGTKFTRDKVGTCIITIKNKEQDFEITLDEDETVEVLVSDILKQQAIIEENKRQQDIAANQFRQAQKDIKLLQAENKRYRNALEFYADDTTYTNEFEDCPPAVELDGGQTARKALEGAAE